jgi:hypothetical protein
VRCRARPLGLQSRRPVKRLALGRHALALRATPARCDHRGRRRPWLSQRRRLAAPPDRLWRRVALRRRELRRQRRAPLLRPPLVAAWRPALPQAGRYRILAYQPYALNGLDESRELRYLIRHADGESLAVVNAERERNWWADLGEHELSPATALVSLSSLAGDDRRGAWVDAIAFVPVP